VEFSDTIARPALLSVPDAHTTVDNTNIPCLYLVAFVCIL
jgi:hypothetical protein